MSANTLYTMIVQLEDINHLLQFFKNISYYAGIMLNAFNDLLCSKLCWHNRLVPSPTIGGQQRNLILFVWLVGCLLRHPLYG